MGSHNQSFLLRNAIQDGRHFLSFIRDSSRAFSSYVLESSTSYKHIKHCFLTRHHVNELIFLLFKYRLSLRNTGTWRNQPLLRGWSWNSSIIPHQGLMVVTLQKHHSVLNGVGSCLCSIILYKWP
ncbi:hypothetical protein V8G54_013814 [Vigna mungo]|uniref:Uncharacterized protein n=1 Tax=Vigna mungo TaxID=3915 RepID=A0AAQ3NFK6_VIGMU